MKHLLCALAALIVAHTAAAQPRTTEAQARSYVLSAFVTGAAHAILSSDVELAPPLRARLKLPPQPNRDKVYEALVDFTQGKTLRVRVSSPAESTALQGHGAPNPVFVIEGGGAPLLVAYDLSHDNVPAVGLLGVPWEEPRAEKRADPPAMQPVAVITRPDFPAAGQTEPFVVKPILFAFRDATLTPQALDGLENAGLPKMAAAQGVQYLVRGHSDRLGTPELNQQLSQRRAEAVRDYLVAKGVAPEQIRAIGLGAALPLTTCPEQDREALVACLAPDRRVTVEIVPAPR